MGKVFKARVGKVHNVLYTYTVKTFDIYARLNAYNTSRGDGGVVARGKVRWLVDVKTKGVTQGMTEAALVSRTVDNVTCGGIGGLSVYTTLYYLKCGILCL